MKIIYTGSLPSGSIQVAPGKDVYFVKGEPVEVPNKLGEQLRASPDWKEAREKKEKE